jgi:hypothetical protein
LQHNHSYSTPQEESEILPQCEVIVGQWKKIQGDEEERQKNLPKGMDFFIATYADLYFESIFIENFEDKVHSIMEQQTKQNVVTKKVDAEASQRKAAILAQYAQVSDGEG